MGEYCHQKEININKTTKQQSDYGTKDVQYVNCPLCNENKYRKIATEWGILGIVKCKSCGLIYVNPRLKEPEKMYWGSKDKYLEEAKLIFEGKQKSHRDVNYLTDLKKIEKIKPTGNFLDIGTNMGMFLRNARKRGWRLFGIEPSPALSEIAREKFGLDIYTGFLHENKFPDNFFDVVTMTDVFEHIAEPQEMLKDVHRIIKQDGLMFIKVPHANFNLLKYSLYKKILHRFSFSQDIFRDIFDSREHIVHYTKETIIKMLDKGGFKVKAVEIDLPIQTPTWRELVGHYYQYPTPWHIDWKNKLVRRGLYCLAMALFYFSGGKITPFASNIAVYAHKK
ncbi:MAG: class I SAM-dependent methyltransferase [Candidatus Omnitrophota bacterium]|nr:MAG: class I SAM-dependent methyltransferase [Candidatus Omnitrophota bacterium]